MPIGNRCNNLEYIESIKKNEIRDNQLSIYNDIYLSCFINKKY
jgi:hypothetical protein